MYGKPKIQDVHKASRAEREVAERYAYYGKIFRQLRERGVSAKGVYFAALIADVLRSMEEDKDKGFPDGYKSI